MAEIKLNNTAKLIHIIKVVQHILFFQTYLPCFNLVDMHGITLIPAYISTHLNVEVDFLSQGRLVAEWHLLPCISQTVFKLLVQLEVDLLASSHTNQCHHYYMLENPLLLEALGLRCISFSTLGPLVLSKFLAENFIVNSDFLFQ